MDTLFVSFQQALAGRYSIDRELGRGGMGVVYLAREVHLDRLVAIKLLPPDMATRDELRERFLREVRLAAKLSHPNIIPIHSVEESGGFVFFVMAYIDGQTLTERVRTRGPLAGSEGARVLREIAWALSYAHGQGFVHRDIKPDNVLIENTTGRVLVADFGIAGAMGQIDTDGIAGTPEFISPEQVLGQASDARSDIYSLGALGFFALTGRLPFEGTSPTAILARHVSDRAPAVASMGVAVSRKVGQVVDRCLLKAPADRPQTADAVADMLSAALEQRREMPAALRAFVKRGSRLNGGGTLVLGVMTIPFVSLVARLTHSDTIAFSSLVGFIVASPTVFLVRSARRLLEQGFTQADLPAAFKAEAEQNAEELAGSLNRPEEIAQNILGKLALVSIFGFCASLLGGMFGMYNWAFGIVLSTTLGTITGVGSLALIQQKKDVDTEFWGRVWTGRIGRMAFAAAKWLIGDKVRHVAMTHRATELSLGLAAEHLFEALPRETRDALGPVPEVLRRLQADAQRLRARTNDLNDAASTDEHVLEMRDTLRARLAESVAALETIRLNLLRLHAGATTIETFTTHLGMAAEVSEQVERLIDAHREVGKVVDYPRLAASTPA